jgi:hypothetical protein
MVWSNVTTCWQNDLDAWSVLKFWHACMLALPHFLAISSRLSILRFLIHFFVLGTFSFLSCWRHPPTPPPPLTCVHPSVSTIIQLLPLVHPLPKIQMYTCAGTHTCVDTYTCIYICMYTHGINHHHTCSKNPGKVNFSAHVSVSHTQTHTHTNRHTDTCTHVHTDTKTHTQHTAT